MQFDFWDLIHDSVAKEFIRTFCGQKLGHGMSRQVFVNRLDPTVVIKIEAEAGAFQNVTEYMVWEEVQHFKKMSKWFAPVVAISPSGTILVQKRAAPATGTLPKQVPAFLRDAKRDNFGFLDGQLVCVDYGMSNFTRGFSLKLRNVNWADRD